ncbi:Transmembrane protein [Burkholderia latens]|uniref:hypothetical protein n=1 Tax=Burkholderia latens TaxID=488446 RepID=UPI0039A42842
MMQSNSSGQNIGPVLVSCARNVALGLCGLALFVGFVAALPYIVDGVAFAWYGWARILTSNYTTVIPAALLEWPALIVAVWAGCVSIKLDRAGARRALPFGLAAAFLLVFVVLPANCAIVAVGGDWKVHSAGHSAIEGTAVGVAFLFTAACMFAPFGALIAAIISGESS